MPTSNYFCLLSYLSLVTNSLTNQQVISETNHEKSVYYVSITENMMLNRILRQFTDKICILIQFILDSGS